MGKARAIKSGTVQAKNKKLLNEIMGEADPTTRISKQYKESWIDKLRYKKIKLRSSMREVDE